MQRGGPLLSPSGVALAATWLALVPVIRGDILPTQPAGFASAPALPQSSLAQSTFVVGQVLDATTNRPIPSASVTATRTGTGSGPRAITGLTNSDGNFLLTDLPPGRYIVRASATNYLPGSTSGSRTNEAARPVEITSGSRVGLLTLRLTRMASIGGTITNSDGRPRQSAVVMVVPLRPASGLQHASPVLAADGRATVRTDDRGAYEASGLLPGRYIVMVHDEDAADDSVPATTLYPGVSTFDAALPVSVQAGDRALGVDIRSQARSNVTISGRVTHNGLAASSVPVHLIPDFAAETSLEPVLSTSVTADKNGVFSFPGVAPGQYRIQSWFRGASSSDPAGVPAAWGEKTISVGHAASEPMILELVPGRAIRGRVVFNGTAAPPVEFLLTAAIADALAPALPRSLRARPGVTWSGNNAFVTEAVPDTHERPLGPVNRQLGNWRIDSVMQGTRNLLIEPLRPGSDDLVTFTFTDQRSTLSGIVAGPRGEAIDDGLVIAFPAAYEAWLSHGMSAAVTRLAAVSTDGAFLFDDLPSGDYLVAPIASSAVRAIDAALVRRLAAVAARATLNSHQPTHVVLRIQP